MDYEIRTYDVRPHTVPEAEQRLQGACTEGLRKVRLVASFHTEIGPLNQVLQIWACADDAARELALVEATAAGAAIRDLVVRERAEAVIPFAVSPRIESGPVGPFFEVRRYRFAPGDLPKIVAAWEAALPTRLSFGPLVLVGSATADGVETLLHIWPYGSLDERSRVRGAVRDTGLWPPSEAARTLGLPPFEFLQQENAIVVPAAFSPLQ